MVKRSNHVWPAPLTLPEGPVATGLLLQMAHRMCHQALDVELRPLGMEVRHFGILVFLAHQGPLSQRQLIDLLGTNKSTMVRIVDELERDGLAERTAVAHDRRTQAISITDRGREQLEGAEGVASDLGERLLARFGEADRQQLHRMLSELIAAAIAAPGTQGNYLSMG